MRAIAVAKYLTGLGLVVYDETLPNCDCFIAHLPDSPDSAVMIMPVPGRKPNVKRGYDSPSLQIKVRDRSIRSGEARATSIFDALQGLRTITLDEGGTDELRLLDCQAVHSGPAYLGPDENGRHEWSLNFDLEVAAATTHRQ